MPNANPLNESSPLKNVKINVEIDLFKIKLFVFLNNQ